MVTLVVGGLFFLVCVPILSFLSFVFLSNLFFLTNFISASHLSSFLIHFFVCFYFRSVWPDVKIYFLMFGHLWQWKIVQLHKTFAQVSTKFGQLLLKITPYFQNVAKEVKFRQIWSHCFREPYYKGTSFISSCLCVSLLPLLFVPPPQKALSSST